MSVHSAVAGGRRPRVRRPPATIGARLYLVWLTRLAVVLGVALRLREWLFDRSLWLDEIEVVHDILGLSYHRLEHVTANSQAAPIGWFWIVKASSDVFGQNEMSLRLFPFLTSVGAFPVLIYVSNRLVGRWSTPAVILLFAVAPQTTFYATDVKQYSSDILASLGVVAMTLWASEREPAVSVAAWWALVTALAIWFSQPGILMVLIGGLVLAARWLGSGARTGRARRHLVLLTAAAVPPALVLLLDYQLVLRDQAHSSLLKNYWRVYGGYPPTPLHLHSSARWLARTSQAILEDPLGVHHPVVVGLLALLGLGVILRTETTRRRAPLLLLPFVVAVVAAAAQTYPLAQRLALYLQPSVLLLICAPLQLLDPAQRLGLARRGRAVVAAGLGLVLGVCAGSQGLRGLDIAVTPLDKNSGRQAVAFIAAHRQPGDIILYESMWGTAAWAYYSEQHPGLHASGTFDPAPAHGCSAQMLLAQFPQGRRIWLFLDHRGSNQPANVRAEILAEVGSIGVQLASYSRPGADGGAWLFQITGSGPPPRPALPAHHCLTVRPPPAP